MIFPGQTADAYDFIVFWTMTSFAVVFGIIIGLIWFWKMSKDKWFRYRIGRVQFIVDEFKTQVGEIKTLLIPFSKISQDDAGFDVGNGRYFIRDTDGKGNPTRFSHRGRSYYHHSWDNPFPHSYVPNSLEARFTPQHMQDVNEGNMARELAEMRSSTQMTAITVVLLIIVLIAVFGMGYLMLQQNTLLQQLLHGGATTATGPSPPPTIGA